MKNVRMALAGLMAGLMLVLAIEAHAADPDTVYIRHLGSLHPSWSLQRPGHRNGWRLP